MFDAHQPSLPIDGYERAVERTVQRIVAKAVEPLLTGLVPGDGEAVRALDFKQPVGGAGALADRPGGGGNRAAQLKAGNEVALRLLGPAALAVPPARYGIEEIGSGGLPSAAGPDARRSAADKVTGKRSISWRLKLVPRRVEGSLRWYLLLIGKDKAQGGGCRTARNAERR